MSEITPKPQSLSLKTLLLDAQGRCLLLRRAAKSKNNAGKWEFPGGKTDPGESFDVTLTREVREETGLRIQILRPFETAMSDLPDRQVVYLVMLAQTKSGRVRLSKEHDAFQWVLPSDFEEVDFSPQFRSVARHYKQFVESQQPPKPPESPKTLLSPANLDKYLREFKAAAQRLERLRGFLVNTLEDRIKTVFPLATITGRAKGLVSFGDKLVKKGKYADPMKEMTDLVGIRVILHLPSEVKVAGDIIRETFHIDEANTVDTLKRLGPDKFGYRSVHYIVEIIKGKPAGVKISPSLIGLKAEIQVRTIAQHAWADIGHDRLYKGACEVSDYWKREASRVAALLEAADEEFQRLVDGISFYEAHRPSCTDEEKTREDFELTRVIQRHAPRNPNLALRLARMAAELKDWKHVKSVTETKGLDLAKKPMLMALRGRALWKLAKTDAQHRAAEEVMESAANLAHHLPEPRLILADCLAEQGRNPEALDEYRRAFEIDPGNPAALSGFLRQKALVRKDAEFISIARPAIQTAVQRCEELAIAKADLPRTRYRIAGFRQLLGPEEEWESLATYALAVHETHSADDLLRALRSVSLLARSEPHRQDIECARRFLTAALHARFPGTALPAGIFHPKAERLVSEGPFVIVAGGCDPALEANMRAYGRLLHDAFADFKGVLISGGTKQGISGLVGEIAASSRGRIRAIGYLPPQLPPDKTATEDKRYEKFGELRRTDSTRFFSAIEAVQVWLDLLASGVKPADVRLLGINGGYITGLEYRFALAMGAQVGLLKNSGREAERLTQEWPPADNENLLILPKDAMTIRAFLRLGVVESATLTPEIISAAAQQVHEDFLDQQRYSHPDPVMQPWAKLREDLRQSNRSQVEFMEDILRANGFDIRTAGSPANNPAFTKEEIECMSEMEHGRWVLERAASGWSYGPTKDVKNKISPYMIDWKSLKEGIREYDRKNVRLWPELLAKAGLEIYRLPKSKSTTAGRARSRIKKRK